MSNFNDPQFLRDRMNFANLRFIDRTWYKWTGTHWAVVDHIDSEIDALIQEEYNTKFVREVELWRAAGQPGGREPERLIVKETTIRAVIRKLVADPDFLAKRPKQPTNQISFTNGVLNTLTRELTPHTPELFITSAPTVAYDPQARCERWRAFLAETLPDIESRQLLQRWCGYCLTSDTSRQRCIMLVGVTSAGKGVIARILAKMVGNTAWPGLHDLGNDHGRGILVGRSLAVIDEATLDFKSSRNVICGTLLSIVGEMPVSCNIKYGGYLPEVVLPCRVMITCNRLINFSDDAEAMARRLMFVHFSKSFVNQQDITLYARLEEELAGIFNWALQGLTELDQCGFPEPKASQETREENRQINNPELGFIEEHLVTEENALSSKADVYGVYREWVFRTGRRQHPLSDWEFGRRLKAAGLTDRRTNAKRYWVGVRLLPTAAVI